MKLLVLLVSTLGVAVDARCSDGKIAGELVSDRYQDQFFYPGFGGNLDDLQSTTILSPGSFTFRSGNVLEERPLTQDVERNYEYQDEDGDQQGGTFNPSDVYGSANVDAFKEYCEEIWACSQFFAQFQAEISVDVTYDTRAVCFDDKFFLDFSITNPDGDREEIRIRENFIVDTCWGGRNNATNFNSLEDLEASRDAICDEAESLVDQLLFDSSQSADPEGCLAAVQCIQNGQESIMNNVISSGLIDVNKLASALDGESMDQIYEDGGVVVFQTCFNKTAAEINQTKTECEEQQSGGGSCPVVPSYPPRVGPPGCGTFVNQSAIPICTDNYTGFFEDFGPAYPDEEPGYVVAVASIKNTFIPCDDDRTSADAVGFILFLKPIFEAIEISTKQIKDAFPNDFLYVPFVFLNFIPKIIVQSFNIVLEQADYHDGLLQGAEIEALYENNKQLLRAQAAIYDEVSCRCLGDFDSRPRRGYGCDSIDNDCDDTVDDCAEDNWPPEIFISHALAQCSNIWFGNETEARDCVQSLVTGTDDCDQTLSLTESDFDLTGTCFTSQFNVTTSDKCGNAATPKIIPVLIDDDEPPDVECGFDGVTGNQLILFDTGASVLEDVKLTYNATDGCGGDVDVSVEVYSNEIEDFQSQELALFFLDGNPNDAAALYIAKGICSTNSNGQCIKDPDVPDARVYTVVVSATDLAEKSSSSECYIVILPQNIFNNAPSFDVTTTSQRFLLTSYSSTFAGADQP